MSSIPAETKPYVYFVTSHPAPTVHFAELALALEEKKMKYGVLCGKEVTKAFDKKKIPYETFDPKMDTNALTELILKTVRCARFVIFDISNPKWTEILQRLQLEAKDITRIVYYENPENRVEGGYSETAAKIIPHAQIILFSNSRYVCEPIFAKENTEIDLKNLERIGLGLFPREEAQEIVQLRASQGTELRRKLFQMNNIEDTGQKILTYAGGANAAYYKEEFPHFLNILEELYKNRDPLCQNTIILLQQHPRAKTEGDHDAKLIEELQKQGRLPSGNQWIVVSKMSNIEALAITHIALYNQTSMAAQFPFAAIDALQIGKNPSSDVLTKNGTPSITNAALFSETVSKLNQDNNESNAALLPNVIHYLGIQEDWKGSFFKALKI